MRTKTIRKEGTLFCHAEYYKQARTTLGKFIEAKFKTKDVAFGQLTNLFISDYYEFLISMRCCQKSRKKTFKCDILLNMRVFCVSFQRKFVTLYQEQ
ncbi:MAG: phage integrase SAM-like domain-containing protein [Prevotella sp.]|nr:phage integrase SAM-like domain-containing protein [Prevotella sp.]